MTCIVPDAAPLWGQLSVALPSAFPSFRFSRLPRRSIVPFDSVIPAHLALRAALRQSPERPPSRQGVVQNSPD